MCEWGVGWGRGVGGEYEVILLGNFFVFAPTTDSIFETFTRSRDRQRQTDHLDWPVARRRMCVIMSQTDHRMMECRRSGNNDRRVASLCRVASLRVCPLTSLSCRCPPPLLFPFLLLPLPPETPHGRLMVMGESVFGVGTCILY